MYFVVEEMKELKESKVGRYEPCMRGRGRSEHAFKSKW